MKKNTSISIISSAVRLHQQQQQKKKKKNQIKEIQFVKYLLVRVLYLKITRSVEVYFEEKKKAKVSNNLINLISILDQLLTLVQVYKLSFY